jgi:hypothetical protein
MPIGSPNAGYLTFNTGQVLTAAQVQYNLQNQTIMYFADAAARSTALPGGTVQEGMFTYLASDDSLSFYNGTSWVTISNAGGDLTAINAGPGITVTNGTGPIPTISLATNGTLTSPKETVDIVPSGASAGTINVDTLTASVEYYTGAATGNWTLNVRGNGSTTLNSTMSVGEQISVVFINTNTGTAYIPSAFNIDGTASGVTLRWLGGSAPATGTVNGIDAYVYTIIKTASATYTVLASQNKF